MAELASMQKYESYKDSGVDWLGDIPSEWNVTPGFNAYAENKRNNKGMKEDRVLSLSYGKIIVKPKEKLVGLVPESFETYQVVEPGDLIIRCMDLQNDKTSLRTGLSENHGIITSAYLNLKINERFDSKFLYYYLHSLDTTKVLYKFGTGLRQNLSFQDFYRLPVIDIPKKLQTAIANFLDNKTAQIDEAIAIKEKQIELLKERKQIIIQQAVTQGLNPNVPMKNSGVDWIGKIPEHWNAFKLAHIAKTDAGSTPDRSNSKYWDGDIPWIKTGEVRYSKIFNTEESISVAGLRNSSLRLAPPDTLIMAMYGQGVTRGRVAILGVPATYNQACCGMTFNKEINVEYAQYFFIAAYPYIRDDGNESSQMNLSAGYIATLKICAGTLDEQLSIVEYLDEQTSKIEEAVSLQQLQIKKLKEYKTTLINSAVTGKIKVPGVI